MSPVGAWDIAGPQQVRGEILAIRRVGDYHVVSFTAPGIPSRTLPGQFVAVSVGGPTGATILRRCFSIHSVDPQGSAGGTVEVVLQAKGAGTRWLADRRRGDPLDVVGPLGRPFSLPKEPVNCLVVGGGYGAAPLFMLADRLRERGCRVDLVLGAATESRLFGVLDGRRRASSVTVATDDGSVGIQGTVIDGMVPILAEFDSRVVYACGPMGMLAAVAGLASDKGIPSQCAVEETMACGIGVCMSCVIPVVGDDGITRMTRSCSEGPVFFGDRVRWADVGTIPADCLGAPTEKKSGPSSPGRGRSGRR